MSWTTNGPLIAVQVMSGLSVGMLLFLVSVGMSLIFGVTRIVNLAHGCFYMVGAYLMVTLVEVLPDQAWTFWLALLLAPIGVAALGGLIEVTLLRLIYHRDPLMQLIHSRSFEEAHCVHSRTSLTTCQPWIARTASIVSALSALLSGR